MTTRILCVGDGAVGVDLMSELKPLESLCAEVTIIQDTDSTTLPEYMDRLALVERDGLGAVSPCRGLLDHCGQAHVIVVDGTPVNREVIDNSPNLKLVAVLRGGVENADLDALKERGIPLVHAPQRSADAVADYTVGMMIAENKNIARSHHFIIEGRWRKNYINQDYVHNMRTRTVGIIGFGQIGSRVAKRLSGFDSRIIAYDPFMDAEAIRSAGAEAVSLEELLEQSDFVTLHLRTSQATHHIIDADALAQMKPTAYLINTARSPLVDEEALAEALREHRIGGAAIDVFDAEPLPADHPYLSLDNVTLTPHIAGTCADTWHASVEIGLEELSRYLRGEPFQNRRI
ncbi:D-3-phosphoglycerate dehydrogenase [Acidipropionibacterium acidipropionici ATCC 4875]|uniref:D-3-phosphoglycerate dehydrogenase n=1 Tax=Acidipropionibacterium acidipropionici (strain ATCC 4875 / DSM 20272 / JCM 6432 / NBRC 12425 / NCIMB 8070 / 4) TaxID=1171373 RepID=K7S249_ACIA4|nr:2-hydroxyacid dehydrogenase [Acidipropionibacterium acidipropionici]AFV88662.1 D-3-phosphoglycerate dehydrogenase [Acidipropionibacterium acidipropionici ATCC 4875]